MFAEAAVERRLARGILTAAGLDDVAHDALVNRGRIDARAPDRFAHGQRAKLRRREALERAKKLAGRCPNGGDDD